MGRTTVKDALKKKPRSLSMTDHQWTVLEAKAKPLNVSEMIINDYKLKPFDPKNPPKEEA